MRIFIVSLFFILLASLQALSPLALANAAQTGADTQDAQGQAALKPIASLKLGDMVLAKSEWKAQGESLSYEPVTDIMVTPAQPRRLVDLVLADGQTLTTTDGHPFNTPEGWRDAILLKKGGKLLLKGDGDSDKTVEIASVTQRTEIQTTYNLEVANAHTFFVGEDGVLVHNGISPSKKRRLREENVDDYGRLTCVVCGAECVVPKRHKKGERPPDNEAHAGHQESRANGGSDDLDNLEIECRLCNLTNGRKNR